MVKSRFNLTLISLAIILNFITSSCASLSKEKCDTVPLQCKNKTIKACCKEEANNINCEYRTGDKTIKCDGRYCNRAAEQLATYCNVGKPFERDFINNLINK